MLCKLYLRSHLLPLDWLNTFLQYRNERTLLHHKQKQMLKRRLHKVLSLIPPPCLPVSTILSSFCWMFIFRLPIVSKIPHFRNSWFCYIQIYQSIVSSQTILDFSLVCTYSCIAWQRQTIVVSFIVSESLLSKRFAWFYVVRSVFKCLDIING